VYVRPSGQKYRHCLGGDNTKWHLVLGRMGIRRLVETLVLPLMAALGVRGSEVIITP
jgi:hypothetical protein